MSQARNSNGNGGGVAAKNRRRRSGLMVWLYCIMAGIYLWDKMMLDTLLVWVFEWFDDDPDSWPVAAWVDGGQMILLVVGMLICTGFGVYNALQEE